jgi:hypothetical protein
MTTRAPGSPLLVARLVWASLLVAPALYCVVLVLVLRSGPGSPSPALGDPLRTILLVLAAAQTLAVWFVWLRFVSPSGARAPGDRVDPQRAIAMHVVCWTLSEAIALYGLVIGVVAHRLEPVFFVWGLVALLLLHPRAENFGPS